MKKILAIRFLVYHSLLTVLLFSNLTMEKEIIPFDGGSDRLYGFPFSYITGNEGCNGCYELYIGPMIIDLLIYFAVIALVLKLIEKAGLKLKTHWIAGLVSLIISSLIILLFFTSADTLFYRFYTGDPYQTISRKFTW